jgi:hypothetical protein
MTNDTHDSRDSTDVDRAADATGSTATVRRDWTQSGTPTVTVTEAVAAATDRETTALPPLQHCVDADALDALVTRAASPVSISFVYADTDVTVHGDGTVDVHVHEHASALRCEE